MRYKKLAEKIVQQGLWFSHPSDNRYNGNQQSAISNQQLAISN
ncbi:hypothetical protein [uncultured Nostoc sp.]